jgi:hypothetical protein
VAVVVRRRGALPHAGMKRAVGPVRFARPRRPEPCSVLRGALEIQCEQFFGELVVGERGVPAVGGEDGFAEATVGEVEPGGALVAEIRERALGEVF